MKPGTIPLAEAYDILEAASAVVIDSVVTYPSLSDLTGEADNEFLLLSWTDEEGQDFRTKFAEGPNRAVRVMGACLWLVDEDGDETAITILVPA